MTVDTLTGQSQPAYSDVPDTAPPTAPAPTEPTAEEPTAEEPIRAGRGKTRSGRTKTLVLTLTVTGTADGEWRAELKQGTSYLARNLTVAAAAVSRAARELHEDLAAPIDAAIDGARLQQAAKVAALEAELDAARTALAELD